MAGKSTGNRTWFHVHSWIGSVVGLMLFVICWSGTFATLSHEFDWLLTPARQVEAGSGGASWGDMQRAVEAAYPGSEVKSLSAPIYVRSAAEVGINLPGQKSIRVFVNPYTARVQGASSYFGVQRFFRSFHMSLFNNRVGSYIVYSFGVILLVLMIAPLIFYKRWWRRFFILKNDRGPRVFWGDLHKLVGLWSLWFALVLGLTGAWYLLEGLRYDAGDGKIAWSAPGDYAVRTLPSREERPLDARSTDWLVSRALAVHPDLDVRTVAAQEGYFYVDGQSEHWLVRDRANKLYLDPQTGNIVFDQRASDQPAYWRWSDTADPLHFGDFGGLATKLIWFIFGVGLSSLCLTGAYLHAKRIIQSSERARWPGTFAAMIVTGVVLAASAKGGWQEVKAYGPVVDGVQHWPAVHAPVAAFIIIWIASTLAAIMWWIRLLWKPIKAQPIRKFSQHLQPAE